MASSSSNGASAFDEIEKSKENVQPLARGRTVGSSVGLSQRDLQSKIKEFEALVRLSEDPTITEMDGDPLMHWIAFIKFYQDNFPADTHDNFLLMERCVRALVKMKRYANDDRFIGVCCKYADKTKNPTQVFKYMHQQKIGTHTALFWIAWAFVAEKENDFAFAEQIFKKGISKNAQPIQMLKIRHQQFNRRMSRHWLNSRATDLLDEYENGEGQENFRRSRDALGGLSRDRVRRNDRSRTTSQQTTRDRGLVSRNMNSTLNRTNDNINSSSTSRHGAFAIFVEPEGENAYNLDQSFQDNDRQVIPRESDRKKENTLEAERWNERGALQQSFQRTARSQRTGPSAAFSVFVDKECAIRNEREEEERRNQMERQRQVRDDRTFRERDDEGVAERLARDPLRYMRDPSRLESDTAALTSMKPSPHEASSLGYTDDNHDQSSKAISERKSRTGFNKRLLRNRNGEEQCFEEARAHDGRFKLILDSSANFNRLHAAKIDQSSQMDLEDGEASLDISMSESLSRSAQHLPPGVKKPFQVRGAGSKSDEKRLFIPNASFETSLNQTANSNASSTINEIDAVGLPPKKEEETINTKLAMRELSMMFSSPAFGVDGTRRHNDQSRASRIDESVDDAQPNISFGNVGDGMMLDNSICNIGRDENIGGRNPFTRTNATSGFENMALREIKQDEDGGQRSRQLDCRSQRLGQVQGEVDQADYLRGQEVDLDENAGFTIYEDFGTQQEDIPPAASFQIFLDRDEERSDGSDCEEDDRKPAAKKSKQDSTSNEDGNNCSGDSDRFSNNDDANGDTASIIDALAISQDGTRGSSQTVAEEDGDTATLSLFNEVFQEIGLNNSRAESRSLHSPTGFEIFVDDDDDEGNNQEDHQVSTTGHCLQGSLHCVQPAIEYQGSHDHDIRMALRHIRKRSTVAKDSRAPLFSLLIRRGKVFHLPNSFLPRELLQKRIPFNTVVSVGKHTGIMKKLLGVGAYGSVFLMNVSAKRQDDTIAIKVQSPTDSLAWEYEVLQRLEDRLSPSMRGHYPFPRPLSFMSLADGGILSMFAASDSGLNLVDLSNLYRLKLGEQVPELVALYYTSVALGVVENLHWHGKVLHCDVKPDNFVLSSSRCPGSRFFHIRFSELTLVDFGRAVDLTQFSDAAGEDVRNVIFHGNAAARGMQCVAMRMQRPWSYDADTFGILCSAHVLLYGSHLEIKKGRDGRWHPTTTLKRYWQQEIWQLIFDSLLNLDGFGACIGSRLSSLRSLRCKIDSYLQTEEKNLQAFLSRQANILPDNRDKIS